MNTSYTGVQGIYPTAPSCLPMNVLETSIVWPSDSSIAEADASWAAIESPSEAAHIWQMATSAAYGQNEFSSASGNDT
jgi:hypothetical protein